MWETQNRTPFSAQGYFIRDINGVEHWTVAVRATFDLRTNQLPKISQLQPPVLLAPRFVDGEAKELAADSDISPFKPKCDFILSGIACLPDMQSSREFGASIDINGAIKRAKISGPRILRKVGDQLRLEHGDPVGGMKLTWRNSLGGRDVLANNSGGSAEPITENPIGRGWTARWTDLPPEAEIRLPTIENSFDPITPGRALPKPFGLGAIQPFWRPRLDYAGTYDEKWRRQRAPLLPDDFDERFHQTAPVDQQFVLKGGELIRATNLSPDGPFELRLPQIILEASTKIGRDKYDSRLKLITVELDTEANTMAMVWNAATPCNGRDMEVDTSAISMRQMAGAEL